MMALSGKQKLGSGAAGLAIACLASWLAVPSPAQNAKNADPGDVVVCIGSDSILRSPPSGTCPPGTQRIVLSGPDIKKLDEKDPLDPGEKTGESDLERRLGELEKRIAELEDSRVFEVVNKKGDVIFSVAPGRVQLYNQSKTAVAALLATPEGGEFVARSADGNVSAFLGALGEHAGLRLKAGGKPRLDLLKQEAGSYSLKIPSGDGTIAGIGESKAGSGALVIGDAGGRPKASMSIEAGKGSFAIFNGSGNGVASLTESVNGGGLLVLTDKSSNAVVMMKTNDNRYGVVMTFPPGFPYVPRSGLPGSYMLGCASNPGGKVCVP